LIFSKTFQYKIIKTIQNDHKILAFRKMVRPILIVTIFVCLCDTSFAIRQETNDGVPCKVSTNGPAGPGADVNCPPIRDTGCLKKFLLKKVKVQSSIINGLSKKKSKFELALSTVRQKKKDKVRTSIINDLSKIFRTQRPDLYHLVVFSEFELALLTRR